MIETLAKFWFVGVFLVWPFIHMSARYRLQHTKHIDHQGMKLPVNALPSWLITVALLIGTTAIALLWPITVPAGWPNLKQGVKAWFRGEL